jgi:hypothetical protein
MRTELTHPLRVKNFTRIDVGPVTLWWSYHDCVAFRTPDCAKPYILDTETVSDTTRRHIESLADTYPLPRDTFETALRNTLTRWTRSDH